MLHRQKNSSVLNIKFQQKKSFFGLSLAQLFSPQERAKPKLDAMKPWEQKSLSLISVQSAPRYGFQNPSKALKVNSKHHTILNEGFIQH